MKNPPQHGSDCFECISRVLTCTHVLSRCGGDAGYDAAAAGEQQPCALGRGAGAGRTGSLHLPHRCGENPSQLQPPTFTAQKPEYGQPKEAASANFCFLVHMQELFCDIYLESTLQCSPYEPVTVIRAHVSCFSGTESQA